MTRKKIVADVLIGVLMMVCGPFLMWGGGVVLADGSNRMNMIASDIDQSMMSVGFIGSLFEAFIGVLVFILGLCIIGGGLHLATYSFRVRRRNRSEKKPGNSKVM